MIVYVINMASTPPLPIFPDKHIHTQTAHTYKVQTTSPPHRCYSTDLGSFANHRQIPHVHTHTYSPQAKQTIGTPN